MGEGWITELRGALSEHERYRNAVPSLDRTEARDDAEERQIARDELVVKTLASIGELLIEIRDELRQGSGTR